ncbi:MAG: FkbM family methyltransferase [Sphingomonadaceae bacterium]|nr:FkbM family methyltransferase [Sphingomonadaceae bacterium]
MNLLSLLGFIIHHPLNSGGRIAALRRFAQWQIASRLIRQPIAMPFVGETRLLSSTGMTGATGNWYNGLHEPEEMAFVLHALRAGDLFVDIGANVGSYSVLAAGAAGAEVIAAEPLPATYATLAANIRLNDLTALVDARCCGLSDQPGELRFTAGLDTMNRVALPDEAVPTEVVPVTTLDQLCGSRMPSVIKIDVEGHELAVLAGGAAVLAAPGLQAVLMETNGSGDRYGHGDEQIIAQMQGHGFSACRYDWRTRALTRADRGAANTIFVRDPAAMTARCQTAAQFRLVNRMV